MRRNNLKFPWYPQNACLHYFFPTKCCRLHKFIRLDCYLSSFSAVIHTSYVSCFLDAHNFCGMHDAHSPIEIMGSMRLSKEGELWIVQDVTDWWWLMIAWTWKVAWESSGLEPTDASCAAIWWIRWSIGIETLRFRLKLFRLGSGCEELRELQLLD